MNNGTHVSLSVLVSSGYMPRNGIAGSQGGFILNFFKGTFVPSSMVDVSVYIPTNNARAFQFLQLSPACIVYRLFDDGHSDQCEVIYHYSFDLPFCSNKQY